jgi:para-nitrobenzyl esterase
MNSKLSNNLITNERFLNIEYAQFEMEKSRWSIRNTTNSTKLISNKNNELGTVSPQLIIKNDLIMSEASVQNQSEHCLNLNIFRSIKNNTENQQSNRPVMVWIHGGGFTVGAGSLPIYDGSNLAKATNTIVVTLNYRLGSLGFLRLVDITDNEITSTGNEGLEDQITALKWIQENIHLYGGDKTNITLFGESAGAMSIACLLAMPKTKGLFHKAIMQSGAGHTFNTVEQANDLAKEFLVSARELGFEISQNKPREQAKQLKQLTTSEVLSIQTHLTTRPDIYSKFGILPFKPVVGDLDLPLAPYEAIKQGCAIDIPIISGSNTDEWTLFSAMLKQKITDEKHLALSLTPLIGIEKVARVTQLMTKQCQQRGLEPTPQNLLSEALTEFWFTQPCYRLLNAQHTAGGKAYGYKLGRKTIIPSLACTHITDIGLVFGNTSSAFHGEEPRVIALVNEIQTCWETFAYTGQLSHAKILWPEFISSQNENKTKSTPTLLFFDHDQSYDNDVDAQSIEFWSKISDKQLSSF